VVNADRIPIGYYRQKIASEKIIADSGVPYTILRAAQFHELVEKVGGVLAKLPVVPIPGRVRLQPVDSRDVAERMVELALGAPAGLVRDLVGPQVIGAGELIRGYLNAAGRRRLTMPMRTIRCARVAHIRRRKPGRICWRSPTLSLTACR